jgi:DNA-binding IclR family transcriptional regulator
MRKNANKPKSEYAIQTVSNALRMLEVFHTEAEMGVSDLARRLDLHKNNAFRLLATLELAGYIQQAPETELYHLGPRCLELGHAFARSHTLMSQARPMLEELARSVGETAHLGVLRDDEVVHLDGVLPDQLVLTGLRVGERLPAHCTALGKVLLADRIENRQGSDAAGATGTLFANRGLTRYTDATQTDPAKLLDELRVVALQGYAPDIDEYAPGLRCVAAPVRDASSRVIGALSLSGPSLRMSEELIHGECARAVTAAASRLSQQLGSLA